MDEHVTSFTVNLVGDTTQEQWTGVFKCKTRLSHRDHLTRDRVHRDLLGPNVERRVEADGTVVTNVTPRAASIAEVFSQLAIRIVDAPSWWKEMDGGMGLSDDNVVSKVYEEAIKAESDVIQALKEKAKAAKKELDKAPA